MFLGQAKLFERGASSDLNLRSNNVDACDFLGDGVFDLAKGEVSNSSLVLRITGSVWLQRCRWPVVTWA